MHKLFREKRQN